MHAPLIAVLLLALTQQQSDTAALVEASKDAKAKRKGSTTKVITNADVKKADKKKVQVTRDAAPAEPAATQTLKEKYEAERTARLIRDEKLKVLNEQIALLEKELAKLEQSYYEANDLNYRDTVIVKRFNEAKVKLDGARNELSAVSSQLAGPPASPES